MKGRYLTRYNYPIYLKYESFFGPSRIMTIKETFTEVRVVEREEILSGKLRIVITIPFNFS